MKTIQQHNKPVGLQRWRPPKPLVGLSPIERMLNRHTAVVCPESRLVVAVLVRAIGDCLCLTNRRERRKARQFIFGADLQRWCDLVGLEANFVRHVARKAGYVADEKQHWQHMPTKASPTKQKTHQAKPTARPVAAAQTGAQS